MTVMEIFWTAPESAAVTLPSMNVVSAMVRVLLMNVAALMSQKVTVTVREMFWTVPESAVEML